MPTYTVRDPKSGKTVTLIAACEEFCRQYPTTYPGKKSVAIRVTLQPTEKTLTDEEIEKVGPSIVAAVGKATGGTLRG